MTFHRCVPADKAWPLLLILLALQLPACTQQGKEKTIPSISEKKVDEEKVNPKPKTTFPQIHTNLNGMVREFVRSLYQDKKGTFWFGTNGDGIIRYAGQTLEKITIPGISPNFRVHEILEDKDHLIWFATSEGLIKFDGTEFRVFSKNNGLQNEEIWGLTIDKSGRIWAGFTSGVCQFDGEKFIQFDLPDLIVEKPKSMMSNKLVFKMIEDRNGTMWFATDGNGIFTYKNGKFTHLTVKNGLPDNNAADIMEDSKGDIWIGTFYGGVSKFDGNTFTHFTNDGIIEGEEAYNFYEDSKGNVWFSAEGFGVYCYDGLTFNHYTTADGLTTNVVQSIFEDRKKQLWFGTWQGLCIFDGKKFVDARLKEYWTN